MKKNLAIIMTVVIMLALSACSGMNRQKGESSGKAGGIKTEDESADKTDGKPADAQMESTVVDETLTGMMKPIDAIMLVQLVDQNGYQPSDPNVYWKTMYYYLCFYGILANGSVYDSENKEYVVNPDVVKEAGRVLFGETVVMPEIPGSVSEVRLGDDGKYYVKDTERPESYPLLASAVRNADGSFEVIAQLTDVHGNILINQSFHLTPKGSVNQLLGPKYYYTVRVAGAG